MTMHALRSPTPKGDAVLAWTDVEAAGAFNSLYWNGVQFLNAGDDGRLLQSASSFDGLGEAFNPTEGGSAASAAFYMPSASDLVQAVQQGSVLQTVNRMAFWTPVAGVGLSNHLLSKRVKLGALAWNVIEHEVSFRLPANEQHAKGQFEFVTGYMPPAFSRFFTLDRDAGSVAPLSDGPGEQPLPVILSMPDGSAAMGVYVPAGTPGGGYGRWRFTPEACVKWNAVSRVANPTPGGSYAFRSLIAFGSLADAVNALSSTQGERTGQVRRLYWATLDRAPDAEGMAFCMSWLATGAQLADVAAGFIASPEFQAKYGNADDAAFITLLYENVLGREPDAAGMDFYRAQLAAGTSRAQIVVGFSESPEFQIKRLLAE